MINNIQLIQNKAMKEKKGKRRIGETKRKQTANWYI